MLGVELRLKDKITFLIKKVDQMFKFPKLLKKQTLINIMAIISIVVFIVIYFVPHNNETTNIVTPEPSISESVETNSNNIEPIMIDPQSLIMVEDFIVHISLDYAVNCLTDLSDDDKLKSNRVIRFNLGRLMNEYGSDNIEKGMWTVSLILSDHYKKGGECNHPDIQKRMKEHLNFLNENNS